MRRLINSTYVTLDGVIGGVSDWPSIEGDDSTGTVAQTELLEACDAVLLGRKTYESFASVWQGGSGDPYSDQMNRMQKYVVSSTLRAPDWENSTVIRGDVTAAVSDLKGQSGRDIVQYGFGPLAHTLMADGLIDELRLWIHPFFFGKADAGDLMFAAGPVTHFTLTDTTTLKSGTIIARYDLKRAG